MKENIFLNILSALNVGIGFVVYLVIGRIFGLSKILDQFFAMYVLLNYIGYFVQIFWEGFTPFYAELKTKQGKKEADKLFSALLNRTVLVSLILIIFVFSGKFWIEKFYFRQTLDFCFYITFLPFLLFQNLILLMKGYLQINFSFKESYILDILTNLLILFLIVTFHKMLKELILPLAYIIGFGISATVGLIFALIRLNYIYSFSLTHYLTSKIIKGSLWLKAGAFFYGAKDIIINHFLLGLGEGVVSAYSYASKFASAVHLVVNAPIIMKFANEVIYLVQEKKYRRIKEYAFRTSLFLLVLFFLVATLVYFVFPIFVKIFWSLNNYQIELIKKFYILMAIYFLVLSVEAPYARILTAFKKFFLGAVINFGFLLVFLFSIHSLSKHGMYYIIVSLSVAQTFNLIVYFSFSNFLLSKKAE